MFTKDKLEIVCNFTPRISGKGFVEFELFEEFC